MTKSFIATLKSHWEEKQAARLIARMTDRELEDVGIRRFDERFLSKARRHRSHELSSSAIVCFPNA